MAVSKQWKFLAVMAAALPLVLGACGGDKNTDKGNTGGGPGGGPGGGFAGLLDGGIEGLLADLDDNVAGSPCKDDTDCTGKNATCSVGGPDAFRSCTGLCTKDDQCGAGGKCVTIAKLGTNQVSYCSKVCAKDADCSSELQCRKGIDVGEVLNGISEIFDGGIEGLAAEETPKICQEKAKTVQLANGAVGKACTADNQATVCGGGQCDTSPLNSGGYCTGSCLEDSHCGNAGGCARGLASSTLGTPGTCLLKCTTNADCRDGYSCQVDTIFFGAGHYCAGILPDGGFAFPFPDAGGAATADAGT